MKQEQPKVSIVTISYNQEKYIDAALESFVNQKTDFSFEIIIADDGSTDQTQSIVRKYEKKYPTLFNNILRKENIGAIPNFKDAIMHAKGEYIALCEGDDFWTDTSKLQRQVDFLERHKDYALVFHSVRVFFEGGEEADSIFPDSNEQFNVDKLLVRNFIQTNSVMYRRHKDYEKLVSNVMPYDWYLHLYHAQSGKIGFIDRVMSAYRRHEEGMWWTSTQADKGKFWRKHGKGYMALYGELLKMYLSTEYKDTICINIKNTYEQIKQFDQDNLDDIVGETLQEYPSVAIPLANILLDENMSITRDLIKKDVEIERLHSDIDRVNKELDLIKTSKTWRLRGRIIGHLRSIKLR